MRGGGDIDRVRRSLQPFFIPSADASHDLSACLPYTLHLMLEHCVVLTSRLSTIITRCNDMSTGVVDAAVVHRITNIPADAVLTS